MSDQANEGRPRYKWPKEGEMEAWLEAARKRRDDREAATRIDALIVLLDSALDCEDTNSHG